MPERAAQRALELTRLPGLMWPAAGQVGPEESGGHPMGGRPTAGGRRRT